MRITADVIHDSVSELGVRITTFVLEYPLFIHNQLLTHRMFSRSSTSSRAIPVKKMVDEVKRDPAIPEQFGENQRGMAPGKLLSLEKNVEAQDIVYDLMDYTMNAVLALAEIGVHKQWANRYLAPFAHIRTVVTATEWDNFYDLRCSDDAQEEIAVLAYAMKDAYESSVPVLRNEHIPLILEDEQGLSRHVRSAISSARCARASYLLHGTEIVSSPHEDIALYEKLSAEGHMSPLEHVAFAGDSTEFFNNFRGWIQLRMIYQELKEYEPYE